MHAVLLYSYYHRSAFINLYYVPFRQALTTTRHCKLDYTHIKLPLSPQESYTSTSFSSSPYYHCSFRSAFGKHRTVVLPSLSCYHQNTTPCIPRPPRTLTYKYTLRTYFLNEIPSQSLCCIPSQKVSDLEHCMNIFTNFQKGSIISAYQIPSTILY